MNLNKVQLIWNITSDIELKSTPNWQYVTSFWVATNRNWKDADWNKQELAEFSNVVLWWKLAEICAEYCKKGHKIYIEWRLQTRSWEKNEQKFYKTEIIWENMIMLQSKWDWWVHTQNTNDYSDKAKDPKAKEEVTVDDIPF